MSSLASQYLNIMATFSDTIKGNPEIAKQAVTTAGLAVGQQVERDRQAAARPIMPQCAGPHSDAHKIICPHGKGGNPVLLDNSAAAIENRAARESQPPPPRNP